MTLDNLSVNAVPLEGGGTNVWRLIPDGLLLAGIDLFTYGRF